MAAQKVARPEDFYGRPNEDAEEWLTHFDRVGDANGWNGAAKYRIVPAYLKGAAGRWWDQVKGGNPVAQ